MWSCSMWSCGHSCILLCDWSSDLTHHKSRGYQVENPWYCPIVHGELLCPVSIHQSIYMQDLHPLDIILPGTTCKFVNASWNIKFVKRTNDVQCYIVIYKIESQTRPNVIFHVHQEIDDYIIFVKFNCPLVVSVVEFHLKASIIHRSTTLPWSRYNP